MLETEYEEIMNLIDHGMYEAGHGIVINDRIITLDDLIIDCGTSTTNI